MENYTDRRSILEESLPIGAVGRGEGAERVIHLAPNTQAPARVRQKNVVCPESLTFMDVEAPARQGAGNANIKLLN